MAYTQKQVDSFKSIVLERIAAGKSLKSILEEDENLPNRSMVYEWLNPTHHKYDEYFSHNYARAREDSSDIDAEKLEGIIDDTLSGKVDPSAARVAMDGIKWIAGKKHPKKYGERTTNDVNLKGDIVLSRLTDQELNQKIREEIANGN